MKKSVFIIIALVVLTFSTTAQETIERIYSEHGKISMIRPWKTQYWLVYSQNDYCDFNKVDDLSNNVDILRLPEDFVSVSDFEVDSTDGWVYFCGMMADEVPYMGYFKMSTFPNSPINYVRFPTLKQLNKLEVMSDYTGAQIIMIGSTEQSRVIVDVTPNGPGWDVYFITTYVPNTYNNYFYDDIAILDQYVVFTSRFALLDNADPLDGARLWYFSKPATAFVPLVSSSLNYMGVPYMYQSSLGIKKCINDAFVIAGVSVFGKPYISGYNGFIHVGTVILDETNCTIKSFGYNTQDMSTDIVLDPSDVLTNGSKTYTLLPGMAVAPGTAYGHRFPGHRLNSLWYQKYNPSHYICVGDSLGNNNDLFLYRYFFNSPLGCSEHVYVETLLENRSDEKLRANINYISNYYIVHRKNPIIKLTGTVIVCEQQKNNQ